MPLPGKFNSLFSMLFALGFTIQLERLEQRAPDEAHSRMPLAAAGRRPPAAPAPQSAD